MQQSIVSGNAAARATMHGNLRELRRRGNLTQIELAQKSGVPRSRIQLAEAGTVELQTKELRAIKAAVIPELLRTMKLLMTELETMSTAQQPPSSQGDSERFRENKRPSHE